ncbi:MAG: metallophosphoesterase [Planctomycetes bacterium]|nr:metallophosphoesterase [Planctomycetota bacterium]
MDATGGHQEARRAPRRYRRPLLQAATAIEWTCSRLLNGKARYRARLARGALRLSERDVLLAGLPSALDGLRIAHLSDFHAGPFLDSAALADLVALVSECDPDLLCLTGDYITHRVEEGIELAPALGAIRRRIGAFAVFGNHDYHGRRESELADVFAAQGIATLRNEGRVIESRGARLLLAGIEDVEEGKVVDLDAALAPRRAGDVVVLLCHHPDVAERVAGRGVDLLLAGHTHGGQVPLLGRLLARGGARSRLAPGLNRVGETLVHVTAGVGVLIVPCRAGAPAEAALLTLRRAAGRVS